MKLLFRAWFTPGSVVTAMVVAMFWLHRLPIALAGRAAIQILLICLTFAGLWVLCADRPSSG